jgi:hypothetical protein
MGEQKSGIPIEEIESRIYLIRGHRVMLDQDLAELYGVLTKALKQAVKRNIDRFPSDFMFVLTYQEVANLRSQIVTSSSRQWGGTRYKPMVFTEQGVAMLSSVLNSARAIEVNIAIMRAFVQLRKMIASNEELARKLDEIEEKYDEQFRIVFDAIHALIEHDEKPPKKIGFKVSERHAAYGKRKV